MPIGRRAALALPSLLLPWRARPAAAQDAFPARPITIVSGYAPGGVTDVTSRAVADRLSRELGQPCVVENRVGAATAVANNAVAQARPDGYTLLMGTSTLAINPALQPNLAPKDPMRELAPVGMVFRTAFVLHVHPGLGVGSTAELIAWAKARPGQLNFSSSGTGAVNHLALALFAQRAGIEVTHVPYRGGAPALLDLRAGRVQAMFSAVLEALPSLRDGGTRGLAISSAGREALLPELPPVADVLPGFDAVFWQGLFAPASTPAPVLARLGTALAAATDDATLRARMAEQGVAITTGDAAALARLLAAETALWGGLIRQAGIRAE
ncbi:tripartite tricarboxylate transporter substrate binding protein [Siccirubricoccus sp. KC 17139]|uniref:Tripartite tricarboxylate transporter substrate binding protein n=1 Tax=Siccirubricoccus soli TaxID=2899147 RepID=A0ABT1DAX7_9PROT|nr:tripartite tricarboxylate transporter substrate-binding protein [Siccirubricoccus soli]MCO6418334.1 tripartite tricarboxylate transporter substrate binding protein [Siccirubricoccus soli]MCP2684469.1 tripartite tricarboxylate transporter substrate-binding protein [Siccirubricoccus soli]